MPNEYCDWTPCKWLQKTFSSKMVVRSKDKSIQLLVSKPRGNEPAKKVTLWYCPFCGTRLYDNKDILEWVEERLKG